MKNMKHKKTKKKEVQWTKLSGRDEEGSLWELDYNKSSRRFDLVLDGDFVYSHMDSKACFNTAGKRGALLKAPKKD